MKPWLRDILILVVGFVLWRSGLFLLSINADTFLDYRPSFPYSIDILARYGLPRWLYSFANFDGVHYITIVEKGYVGTGLIQAFFPIYPLLTWLGTRAAVSPIASGLLLATLAAGAVTFLLYQLARLDLSRSASLWSVLALATFPTSFFLGSMYSESLFIALVLAAFWAARTQRWALAGGLAAIASATRVVGIALVPALILELMWQTGLWSSVFKLSTLTKRASVVSMWARQHALLIGYCLFGAAGLLGFMWFLFREFGDAFYFLHVQSEFGAGRSEQIVLYPQVVWRSLKILATYRPIDLKYLAYIQEAVVGIGGMGVLLLGIKRIRPSYWLYCLLAFLVPTLTGTFSSMPRYVLVCFPLFLLFGDIVSKNKGWRLFYLVFSGTLLIINTILFVQGYWIA